MDHTPLKAAKKISLKYTIFHLPYDGRKKNRKKVNFMINENILHSLKQLFPERERSDFVNEALNNALTNMARKRAMDAMDVFRKTANWKITDEEIRKAREDGRA